VDDTENTKSDSNIPTQNGKQIMQVNNSPKKLGDILVQKFRHFSKIDENTIMLDIPYANNKTTNNFIT